jgi:hypothetical protein
MKNPFFLLLWSCLFVFSVNGNSQGLQIGPKNGGWEDDYKALLSEADIAKLGKGEEVKLKFNSERPGFKASGLIRVLPTAEPETYNFIEIGEWKKEFDFKRSNSDRGKAKVEMRLDSLGNIIISKAFEMQVGQDRLILREELTLQEEIFKDDIYHLHLVRSYYKTGELWIEGYQRILEFEKPLSHMDKKSKAVKSKKEYGKDGKLKSEKYYDLDGKVLKR